MDLKPFTLAFVRVSVGLLIALWGIDKIVDVDHAVAISDGFYLGLFSAPIVLQAFGVLQTGLGLAMVVGWLGRWVYPAVIVINGVSLLAVWRSIIDPWGWVLEGTNVLFFPSLLIFAASLLVWAWRDHDAYSVDGRRAGAPANTVDRIPTRI